MRWPFLSITLGLACLLPPRSALVAQRPARLLAGVETSYRWGSRLTPANPAAPAHGSAPSLAAGGWLGLALPVGSSRFVTRIALGAGAERTGYRYVGPRELQPSASGTVGGRYQTDLTALIPYLQADLTLARRWPLLRGSVEAYAGAAVWSDPRRHPLAGCARALGFDERDLAAFRAAVDPVLGASVTTAGGLTVDFGVRRALTRDRGFRPRAQLRAALPLRGGGSPVVCPRF